SGNDLETVALPDALGVGRHRRLQQACGFRPFERLGKDAAGGGACQEAEVTERYWILRKWRAVHDALRFATTARYAFCKRSATLGPFFLRFTPRWVSRNSSMKSAHSFGPPSSSSCARIESSSVTGRCRRPHTDICASTGKSSMPLSVR